MGKKRVAFCVMDSEGMKVAVFVEVGPNFTPFGFVEQMWLECDMRLESGQKEEGHSELFRTLQMNKAASNGIVRAIPSATV